MTTTAARTVFRLNCILTLGVGFLVVLLGVVVCLLGCGIHLVVECIAGRLGCACCYEVPAGGLC